MKRFVAAFLIFFAALGMNVEAQNRSVATGLSFNNMIADLNAELDYLYDKGFTPLDSVSGTNTITASIEGLPALTGYSNGLKVRLKPVNNNTGAVTLNIDSQGAINVRDAQGSALSSGDLASGKLYWLEYSSSDNEFRVLSFLGGGGASSGIAEYAVQVFTASGTYTKPADLLFAYVECVGGGGGGGGGDGNGDSGAGGGGGAYAAEQFATADFGATETVTIGAAGSAGTGGTAGTAGGNTTFGSLLTANGGAGGDDGDIDGTAGGTASGGDININGGRGDASMTVGTTPIVSLGGKGGDSKFGFGGAAVADQTGTGTATTGNTATGFGGGGGGGATDNTTDVDGGAGTAGLCVVHEFKS